MAATGVAAHTTLNHFPQAQLGGIPYLLGVHGLHVGGGIAVAGLAVDLAPATKFQRSPVPRASELLHHLLVTRSTVHLIPIGRECLCAGTRGLAWQARPDQPPRKMSARRPSVNFRGCSLYFVIAAPEVFELARYLFTMNVKKKLFHLDWLT